MSGGEQDQAAVVDEWQGRVCRRFFQEAGLEKDNEVVAEVGGCGGRAVLGETRACL